MRIIGGPFSNVQMLDCENKLIKRVSNEGEWFISGRAALFAITREIESRTQNKTVYVPSFYCETIVIMLKNIGFSIKYYDIKVKPESGLEYKIDIDEVNGTIILCDYYGFDSKRLNDLASIFHNRGVIVISDASRSLFSFDVVKNADYYFCSVRKWTGVKTGGFVSGIINTKYEKRKKINTKISSLFDSFIKDYERYMRTGEGERNYFSEMFWKCELEFSKSSDTFDILEEDIRRLSFWNTEAVIKKRQENASYISSQLGSSSLLIYKNIGKDVVPFFVPIMLKDSEQRDNLCRELDNNNIFCSIPWSKIETCEYTCELSRRGLELICDERYSLSDIERMLNIIKKTIY